MIRPLRLASLLLAFVLPFLPAQAQRRTPPPKNEARAVAVVNGQKIPFKQYEDLYRDQISYQLKIGAGTVVQQETEDALFLQLVEAELLRQEAVKRKVKVTRDQAVQALLKNPPDFMREAFLDEKGVFMEETFRKVVLQPEVMGQMLGPGANAKEVVAKWKADLEKVVLFVQNQETKRLLKEKLFAEKPLTADQIRRRYIAERTLFNGSFIRVLHSTVPDSLVPVTEREARAWYDSHLDDYRFASARQVASILIPVVPSAADTAALKSKMASARETVMNAPVNDRPRIIADLLNSFPANRFPEDAVNMLQVPKEIRESLGKAKIGDMIGPFSFEREDVLFYVEDTVSIRDTVVRARHILMKVAEGNVEEDTTIRNLLREIRKNIKSLDHFLQGVQFYSQDGSNTRGGDLGYFGRGSMVPQFDSVAYTAPVGEAVGPFRTRYGWHLLWVDQRTTTAYKIKELRFPFAPSQQAVEKAYIDAADYARAMQTHTATDSLFFEFKARYPRTVVDTSILHRLDIYGDALAAANFAFTADSGDVGVFSLPFNRVMIAKVIFAYPTGVAPYEKIKYNFVLPHVQRKKQLDMLAPSMKALADTMTPEMTVGNIRLSAPWAESFMVQNQYLTSPPDEDTLLLDSCMEVARDSSVTGPVRGKHGYYFLRVINKLRTPTEADYRRDQKAFTAEFTDRYREKLLTEVMMKAREYAAVDDLRSIPQSSSTDEGRPPGARNY